jgi:hypothetical protein
MYGLKTQAATESLSISKSDSIARRVACLNPVQIRTLPAGLTIAQASQRLATWKKLQERKDVPSDESAADACEISVIVDGAERCK